MDDLHNLNFLHSSEYFHPDLRNERICSAILSSIFLCPLTAGYFNTLNLCLILSDCVTYSKLSILLSILFPFL